MAENERVGKAFATFINSQKENISGFVNTIISEDGTPSDAAIEVTDDTINVYQFAPDKGYVLGETAEGSKLPVELIKYKDLEVGKKYLLNFKEFISLCVKTKEGKPDGVLGRFKTQNDAVENFNTEGALTAYKNWSDREAAIEKREAKQQAKLKKLAGGDIQDAEVVEETPVTTPNE